MGQHDNPTVSDTPSPSPHQAISAGVHQEAGFSHVGDKSGNTAWSQMTGATKGSSEQSLAAGTSGAGGSPDGSIDFASHPNIYNQSDAHSHSGMPGGASGIEARSAGVGSQSLANPGGDAALAAGGSSPSLASPGADAALAAGGHSPSVTGPGADSPFAHGVASSSLTSPGGEAALAAGGGVAPDAHGGGAHPIDAGGPDLHPGGTAGSPDNGLTATDKSKISDGQPSSLEPSGQSSTGFERLSAQDQLNAPVDKLNDTVSQNNQNLVSRIGQLGDQLPRVAFHGATAPRRKELR